MPGATGTACMSAVYDSFVVRLFSAVVRMASKGGLLDVGAEVIGQLDRPHPREQAVGAAPLRVMPYAR